MGKSKIRHLRTSKKGKTFPAGKGVKKVIAIGYRPYGQDEPPSVELFEDAKKAYEFAEQYEPVDSINLVEVNNTYKEPDGTLNYEDTSDTFLTFISITKPTRKGE